MATYQATSQQEAREIYRALNWKQMPTPTPTRNVDTAFWAVYFALLTFILLYGEHCG